MTIDERDVLGGKFDKVVEDIKFRIRLAERFPKKKGNVLPFEKKILEAYNKIKGE